MELECPRLLAPDVTSNRYSQTDLNCTHSKHKTRMPCIVIPWRDLTVSRLGNPRRCSSLDVLTLAQALSPESYPNAPLPGTATVGQYPDGIWSAKRLRESLPNGDARFAQLLGLTARPGATQGGAAPRERKPFLPPLIKPAKTVWRMGTVDIGARTGQHAYKEKGVCPKRRFGCGCPFGRRI